jgi:putative flippase GtrA
MPLSVPTGGMFRVLDEFIRFSLVGVVGFLVDATTLYAMMGGLGFGPYSGRCVSYLVAATTTWYLNRRFTFRRSQPSLPQHQWAKFVSVNAIGGGVNYGTYAALISLGIPYASHPLVAVGAGSVAGLAFNFTASRALVFGSRRD